jgi:hypothetical protein
MRVTPKQPERGSIEQIRGGLFSRQPLSRDLEDQLQVDRGAERQTGNRCRALKHRALDHPKVSIDTIVQSSLFQPSVGMHVGFHAW